MFVQNEFKELLANNNEAVFAGIKGQAYEAYVHREFRKLSGEQLVKRLLVNGTVEDAKLVIPELKAQRVFDDVKELKDGEYGVPRARNFAAVDAVIRPGVAPQMSVTAHHGFKVDGLKAVKVGLNLKADECLHVPIICPKALVADMKWQPLTRGKQRIKKPQGLVDGTGLKQYCLGFDWE